MSISFSGRKMFTVYLLVAGSLLLSVVAIARGRLLNLSGILLKDSAQNTIQLSDTDSNSYFVFVFLSPECPISQQYTLTLNALAKNNHARFYGVIPGNFYDAATINEFKKKYNIIFPLLMDTNMKLTKSLGASITPQAVVVQHNDIMYSGAIDNAYVSLGKKQSSTTAYYLKDALLAIQNKELVRIKKTNAVGCLIELNTPAYKN